MLSPDATVPPEVSTFTSIDVPDYVGTDPTAFDGKWVGYLIVDFMRCLAPVQTYYRLTFEISNGLMRRIDYLNADGFVNKQGVYVARVNEFRVDGWHRNVLTFSGRIAGDRLSGEWYAWELLCNGRVELIRSGDDSHYCVDRLNGRPYSSSLECKGVDKLLTKDEFDSWKNSPKWK